MGVQGVYQRNRNQPGTNTTPFVPNFTNQRIGAYLIEAHPLGADRLEWGVRYDYQTMAIQGRQANNDAYFNSLVYQSVTATLGWIKEIDDEQRFRTNVGLAWRPPNVSELYSFGRHQTSIEYGLWRYSLLDDGSRNTNVILTQQDRAAPAERGVKWIGTYELSQGRWQTELTAYVNYIENYLYTQPAGITQTVRGAFPYFIYVQDDALLAGVDVSAVYQHNERLTSTVRGNYLWAKNVAKRENFVGLPPPDIRYQVTHHLPKLPFLKESSWDAEVRYTFRQFQSPRTLPLSQLLAAEQSDQPLFATDDSAFDILAPPPGYWLVNLGWTGGISNFQMGVQVRNLLNQRYRSYTDRLRYFADEPGRNLIVSLKYAF